MTLEAFLERVLAMVDELDIPYMLTGSLASAYYGEPRGTRDVDLVNRPHFGLEGGLDPPAGSSLQPG